MDSHGYFLRVQGAEQKTVDALLKGDLEAAALPAAEKALLVYARKVTERAHATTPADVEQLREHDWSEEQISEAVYIIAMFAFFNRVADAFGIRSMGYLEMPAPEPES